MSKVKPTSKNSKVFGRVYQVVKKITEGKVATYGQISEIINSQFSIHNLPLQRITPRVVGFALHANRDPNTPCHRVVNREGRLAPGFAFDGPREQKRRLEAEGIEFTDENHVDLKKHLWKRS